jgi:hypothetical protein
LTGLHAPCDGGAVSGFTVQRKPGPTGSRAARTASETIMNASEVARLRAEIEALRCRLQALARIALPMRNRDPVSYAAALLLYQEEHQRLTQLRQQLDQAQQQVQQQAHRPTE